ncbi:hypothetical protein PQU92_10145 [Asticcacaulis sp. BYS171W]|uniref:Uncharacterized protein n=1 Tax=Asticcacaulis aquaticus TaxID=2984212 RepID=A0ABT5HUB8_9CAUL|nr:hypothetical protein [Asticcacaulis aquaticus]MDC7683639.1 hypothetical protein [Asticcacaulis aquaticus]
MKTKIFSGLALAGAALAIAGMAFAQSGYSKWYYLNGSSGVDVYYSVRVDQSEIRVMWKCVNTTSTAKSCSVGAGQEKIYFCRANGSGVGSTNSLGERATVNANAEYVFPSDFACRGLGATEVQPSVRISIEN